jgi:enoyl-CoA hydratase/carnithine racemase
MTDESPLLVERNGGLVTVRLNRPDRRNAISRQLLDEFGALGKELTQDASARVCVVSGVGDKAFCAGADLKERLAMSDNDVRELIESYREKLGWLASPDIVSVAAINGVALGGGLELALFCDFRFAHERANIGLPETTLGIIPGAGGTQLLPRLIGESRAKELILFGKRISADEALEYGLVREVVRGDTDVVERAREFAEPLSDAAPIALRAALMAIHASGDTTLAEGLEVERSAYELCLVSDDRREALLAFKEKRAPKFSGR